MRAGLLVRWGRWWRCAYGGHAHCGASTLPSPDDGELVYRHMTQAFDDTAPEGEYPPDLYRLR
jgi:hypothetical protein